jgi:outer membrane immunogenic protein
MKQLIWAAPILVGLALPSAAADLNAPARTVVATPVAGASAFTWTGFYSGVDIGYGWGKSTYDVTSPPNGFHVPLDPKGVLGGIFAGYNYQLPGGMVVGAEADLNLSGVRSSGINGITASGATISSEQYGSHLQWEGSARARVGYAIDRLLPFVTGGLAFGGYRHTAHEVGFPSIDQAWSDTRFGWTLGAGLEYAITDRIAARLEYRYVDLGSHSYGLSSTGWYAHKVNLTDNEIRLGLSYKFN